MPANLTPEYIRLEMQLRETREPNERLAILREMLTVIPKHKGTEKMRADLRRRISKLEEAATQKQKRGGKDHFHVPREGAGQIVMAGAPNAGKSSLLDKLTHAAPQVADYPYTTQLPQPGMMPFEDIQIQLVDAPPLSREYTETALFNTFRVTDLILFIVDLTDPDPVAVLKDTVALLEEHFIRIVPEAPQDRAGNLAQVQKRPVIFANKIDAIDDAPLPDLAGIFTGAVPLLTGSAETSAGLAEVPRARFDALEIIRIYTKKPGKKFEREAPFVLPEGATVIEAARVVHKDLAEKMQFTRLWGSGKHEGLSVPRDHVLADGDILEIHAG